MRPTDCEKELSNELVARAQLFGAIEGGLSNWSREVFEKGAEKVIEFCKSGEYKETVTNILKSNGHQVLEKLEELGIGFIVPGSQFDELPAPPIGLTFKDLNLLIVDTLQDIVTGKQIGRASCRERV